MVVQEVMTIVQPTPADLAVGDQVVAPVQLRQVELGLPIQAVAGEDQHTLVPQLVEQAVQE